MTSKANGAVIDASVALAWGFSDESSEYANAVLVALEGQKVLVPAIWSLEITNALLAGERRKRIRPTEVRRFVELLQGLNIEEESQPLGDAVRNVLPLAREYNLTTYDAAYLDLSIRYGLPLATLDISLKKAGVGAGITIFEV